MTVLLIVLGIAWLLGISLKSAFPAPPEGADMSLAPWYQSLKIGKTGGSCCGAADCRNYPVSTASAPDGTTHYRVLYEGKWLDVPEEAIQDRTDNPTGDYVVCVQRHWSDGDFDPQVLCFINAPRT